MSCQRCYQTLCLADSAELLTLVADRERSHKGTTGPQFSSQPREEPPRNTNSGNITCNRPREFVNHLCESTTHAIPEERGARTHLEWSWTNGYVRVRDTIPSSKRGIPSRHRIASVRLLSVCYWSIKFQRPMAPCRTLKTELLGHIA